MLNKRQGQWLVKKPQSGDEIMVLRSVLGGLLTYSHHGVYFSDNEVYQFHGDLSHIRNAQIDITDLEYFRTGDGAYPEGQVKVYVPSGTECRLPISIIRQRAKSRLYTKGFNDNKRAYMPFSNNCEHFATWACYGRAQCYQFNYGVLSAVLLALLFCLMTWYVMGYMVVISSWISVFCSWFAAQIGLFLGISFSMYKLHRGLYLLSKVHLITLAVWIITCQLYVKANKKMRSVMSFK